MSAIFTALEQTGAKSLALRDPTVLPRAIKNPAEVAGTRTAHARDGAALSRFLHWLSVKAPGDGVDEMATAAKLQEFRAEPARSRICRSIRSRARGRTGPWSIIA